MRLHQSYNFLGSGCPVCYRGIFSGLSNETAGTASYTLPVMDSTIHQLIAVTNTYQFLLQRYAAFIIRNKLVASFIAEEVFNEYADRISIIPSTAVRNFLKTTTHAKCRQWLEAKPAVMHARKPKNPT